jgi:hypothetical protein
LIIIKKLFLAILGGVLAASAFYWYLDRANPLLQMADQYQEQRGVSGKKLLDLPDVNFEQWNKVELFDVLSETFDLSKALGEVQELDLVGKSADPLLERWIGGLLNRQASITGKAPLSADSRARMINLLLNMREATQGAAMAQRDGKKLSSDDKVKVASLMAKGELLFDEELGMPLSGFMAKLTKGDLRALLNPPPGA